MKLIVLILVLPVLCHSQTPSKIWDKVYGGTESEWLTTLIEIDSQSILLCGSSSSGNSGNKTQTSRGNYDYWVVKTDLNGNIIWDKRFGGIDDDGLSSVVKSPNGGFVLAGSSNSGIGGDKTQPRWDTTALHYDYWIIKIDEYGNYQWDKRYGGIGDDGLTSINLTNDGGYILGGYSTSDNTGDKSQPNWISGTFDYWVIRIDSLGNVLWDKRFGGLDSDYLLRVYQKKDGSFILGGTSNSGIGGNKSQPSWGNSDYWIVKINSVGAFLWDKRFGGIGYEELWDMQLTNDGGYILAGISDSDIGVTKQIQIGFQESVIIGL